MKSNLTPLDPINISYDLLHRDGVSPRPVSCVSFALIFFNDLSDGQTCGYGLPARIPRFILIANPKKSKLSCVASTIWVLLSLRLRPNPLHNNGEITPPRLEAPTFGAG